jgi:hypothetical protein
MAIPFLTLTTEAVRALYVNVNIQTAVDAACSAAVQAVDVPHFVLTGEVVVDGAQAAAFAQREFAATVANSNLQSYVPALTGVNIVNNTVAQCSATAFVQWFLPGLPPLTINVASAAEALARR